MTLATQISGLIEQVFANQLLKGYTVAPAVTVTRRAQGAYSITTGGATDTDTTVNTTGIVRSFSAREIAQSGGVMQSGDVRLMLRFSGSFTDVDINDLFATGGVTYAIVGIPDFRLINGTKALVIVHGRPQ